MGLQKQSYCGPNSRMQIKKSSSDKLNDKSEGSSRSKVRSVERVQGNISGDTHGCEHKYGNVPGLCLYEDIANSQQYGCEVIWDCASPGHPFFQKDIGDSSTPSQETCNRVGEMRLSRRQLSKRSVSEHTPSRSSLLPPNKSKRTISCSYGSQALRESPKRFSSRLADASGKTAARLLFFKCRSDTEKDKKDKSFSPFTSDTESEAGVNDLSPIDCLDILEKQVDAANEAANESNPSMLAVDLVAQDRMNQSFCCKPQHIENKNACLDSFNCDDDSFFNESVIQSTQAIEEALFDKASNQFVSPLAAAKVLENFRVNSSNKITPKCKVRISDNFSADSTTSGPNDNGKNTLKRYPSELYAIEEKSTAPPRRKSLRLKQLSTAKADSSVCIKSSAFGTARSVRTLDTSSRVLRSQFKHEHSRMVSENAASTSTMCNLNAESPVAVRCRETKTTKMPLLPSSVKSSAVFSEYKSVRSVESSNNAVKQTTSVTNENCSDVKSEVIRVCGDKNIEAHYIGSNKESSQDNKCVATDVKREVLDNSDDLFGDDDDLDDDMLAKISQAEEEYIASTQAAASSNKELEEIKLDFCLSPTISGQNSDSCSSLGINFVATNKKLTEKSNNVNNSGSAHPNGLLVSRVNDDFTPSTARTGNRSAAIENQVNDDKTHVLEANLFTTDSRSSSAKVYAANASELNAAIAPTQDTTGKLTYTKEQVEMKRQLALQRQKALRDQKGRLTLTCEL